jgi:hypothetical protein
VSPARSEHLLLGAIFGLKKAQLVATGLILRLHYLIFHQVELMAQHMGLSCSSNAGKTRTSFAPHRHKYILCSAAA